MKEVSQKNYGVVIAYIVPGLVVLWGVSFFSSTVKLWLTSADGSQPTVAGFLYVTLGSLAMGLTIGAVRSVTIDPLHHWTGVAPPALDFSDFQAKFWAFNQLVESHYRYYQFYAHMSLAVPGFLGARLLAYGTSPCELVYLAPCLILEVVLLAVSRGTLKTYYARVSHLLGKEDVAPFRVGGKTKKSRSNKGPKVEASEEIEEDCASQVNTPPKQGRVPQW